MIAMTSQLLAGRAVNIFVLIFCLRLFDGSIRVDQEQAKKRSLILVSGFIHDVGSFIDEHPGGPHLLIKLIGKDATTAFFGGVYDHSNAAHNVRASHLMPGHWTDDCNSYLQ